MLVPGRTEMNPETMGCSTVTFEGQAVQLAVSELALVGDDYSVTQAIASAARNAGFDGVLAPAAALPGRKTLAVFAHALTSVISV